MGIDGIFLSTVILIILLLLFKRISITVIKEDKINIIIDTGIISLTLSNFKKKSKDSEEFICLLPAIKFILKGTRVSIEHFAISDITLLSEKHSLMVSIFIFVSSIIPLLTKLVKEIRYLDNDYLIGICRESPPEIKISFNVFFIRLIIFFVLVAYYKIKYAIKRGSKYA